MFYRIAKSIVYPFFHSYIRLDVVGQENIPMSGGVLLAPNHRSYLDPVVLGISSKRQLYFMAKEELFNNAVSRYVLSHLHAFPVKRGRIDRDTLKRSLRILDQGRVLMIFPEGTIPPGMDSREGKPGIAWLALKSEVPVVPVKITGSDKLLPDGEIFPKSGKARIVFGRPISFNSEGKGRKEQIKAMTEKIIEEIDKL